MSTAAATITAILIEISISLTVLIVAALLIDLALRPFHRPHLRLIPWLLVLARAMTPGAWLTSLGLPDGLVPANPWFLASNTRGTPIAAATENSSTLLLGGAAEWIAFTWIVGAIALAIFGARRYRALRTGLLARSTTEIPHHWRSAAARAATRMKLRRVPRLAVVPDLATPLVLGVWRPIVLVPPQLPLRGDFEEHGERGYEHVLLHEFAHLVRRDPILAGVSATLQIALWFHPLFWWARRQLAAVIELATDAHVARVLREETVEYRSTLLRLAAHVHGLPLPSTPRVGLPGMGFMGMGFSTRRANIITRLRSLERGGTAPRLGQRALGAGLALILTVTLLPMCRLAERNPAPSISNLSPEELFATDPAGCLLTRYAVLAALSEEPAPR